MSKSVQEEISKAYISFDEDNLEELECYMSMFKIEPMMSEKLMVKDDASVVPTYKKDIEYI